MPTCKKCNVFFPNRLLIDGAFRNISKRVYCLQCSPWNKHNTRQIHIRPDQHCICTACGKGYDVTTKYRNTKVCRACCTSERRYSIKKQLVDYKGGQCEICGYNRCLSALSFHHIDPASKDISVAGNHCLKLETLKKEVDKCRLLCNNCHSEVHADVRNFINGAQSPN